MAYTVHDGHGTPPTWRQKLIAAWLTANDVDPNVVSAAHPVTVLMVPFRPADEPDGPPWMIQVIVLHQYYVRADGAKETDLILRRPVVFQRTVPLKVPFPADTPPGDEGAARGEEPQVQPVEEDQRPPQHQERTQGDEQQAIRPAQAEEVPHRRSGARPQRPGEGVGSRIAGAEEGRSKGRGAQVPEPQEKRQGPQEEVTE
jgi:hypothetical protein